MPRRKKPRPTAWEAGDRSVCAACGKDFKTCPHSVLDGDQAAEAKRFHRLIARYRRKKG